MKFADIDPVARDGIMQEIIRINRMSDLRELVLEILDGKTSFDLERDRLADLCRQAGKPK